MKRSSGILLAISSLPSNYGFGTLGREAYKFVDFLVETKQTYWQILPIGPLSYGNSPYSSTSNYAGNPYFIDLDMLVDEGLLDLADVESCDWGSDITSVDYGAMFFNRGPLLETAAAAVIVQEKDEFQSFKEANSSWIFDYAIYDVAKRLNNYSAWYEWEDISLRLHKQEALDSFAEEHAEDIDIVCGIQYLFFKQWNALKEYCRRAGIQIIGDIPIYLSRDSVDVWANPAAFQLDENNQPIAVSGVPADPFSADGQLWGNPLYDWDKMAQDGYTWWLDRVRYAFDLYDIVRIDHFIGMSKYWAVPFGAKTAALGEWHNGPGKALIDRFNEVFQDKQFIVEALGTVDEKVIELVDYSGYPNMKLLAFAFDSRDREDHIPDHYIRNSVCYTGTHDNTTLKGWIAEASMTDLIAAKEYFGVAKDSDLPDAMINCGMESVANVFIAQMQDYLGLGAEARMNTPGTIDGNWQWRLMPDYYSQELVDKILGLTLEHNRA